MVFDLPNASTFKDIFNELDELILQTHRLDLQQKSQSARTAIQSRELLREPEFQHSHAQSQAGSTQSAPGSGRRVLLPCQLHPQIRVEFRNEPGSDDDDSELQTPSTIGIQQQNSPKVTLLPTPLLPRTTLSESIQRLFPVGMTATPSILSLPESFHGDLAENHSSTKGTTSDLMAIANSSRMQPIVVADNLVVKDNLATNIQADDIMVDISTLQFTQVTEFCSVNSSPANETTIIEEELSPFRERIPSTSTPHVTPLIDDKQQNVSPSEVLQSSVFVQLKKNPCKSLEEIEGVYAVATCKNISQVHTSTATSPMETVASNDFSCQALVPSNMSNVGMQVSHE